MIEGRRAVFHLELWQPARKLRPIAKPDDVRLEADRRIGEAHVAEHGGKRLEAVVVESIELMMLRDTRVPHARARGYGVIDDDRLALAWPHDQHAAAAVTHVQMSSERSRVNDAG